MVVVGALLGVAGFAADQTHSDWRPHATKTALGWRVTQPSVGVNQPSLAGDHLAWQAGTYTVAMDLRTGKARLLGNAGDAQSLTPPAASPNAAVWVADAPGSHANTLVYVYDFSSGRRRHLSQTSADLDTPAIAGESVYWLRGEGSATAVVACDLASGKQQVLASGSGLGSFLLADGTLVVWSRQSHPSAPFVLTMLDTADGTTTDLALPGQSSGAIFDTPVLAADTLAWLRTDDRGSSTIDTYDLRTLVARQITAGRNLVGPAFDGTTVVWAQPATTGGGEVVMGLRLTGGPAFQIAQVPDGVQYVMVSGDRVAWWVGTGPSSWLGVSRLPR